MSRQGLMLALLVAFAVIIAGCAAADDEGGDETADASADGNDEDDTGNGDARADLEGETLTFVVAYGEGGGYDQEARMMAPYLEEHFNASVEIENIDGAGGLVAAQTILTDDPDGTTWGYISGQGLAASVVGGAAGADFDPADFSYIGRVSADARILFTNGDSGLETMEDVVESEGSTYASSGPGGSDHIDASVLIEAFDLDTDIITGYAGGAETRLAAITGETDMASGTYGASHAEATAEGAQVPLTIADERHEAEPDVPAVTELDDLLDDDGMALAEAHVDMQDLGRLLFAPPNMDDDVLAALENAFAELMENEDFIAEMEAQENPILWMGSDDATQLMADSLDPPDVYRQILEESYADD